MCPLIWFTIIFEHQNQDMAAYNETSLNLRMKMIKLKPNSRIKMKVNCGAAAQHETHSGISATAN